MSVTKLTLLFSADISYCMYPSSRNITEARKYFQKLFQTWMLNVRKAMNGTPLQYSCLENPMDGGAWQVAVHGVAASWTRLSGFAFTFHFHAPEKEMATHSSIRAWRIPGTGEPGGLPSMGLHTVRHNLATGAAKHE